MSESQANRVKRMRKALGWTQQDLARHAGCSQGAVGNLEGTKQRNYSLETITLIAAALGTSVDYLELKDDTPLATAKTNKTHSPMGEQLAQLFDDLPDDRLLRHRAYIAASQIIIGYLSDAQAKPVHDLAAKVSTQS